MNFIINTRCYTCNKLNNKLFYCGGCKKFKYCSLTCQKNNWIEHKKICVSPLELGTEYFEKKEYSNAIKWFFIAAEKKDYIACLNLSDCYIYAIGLPRNMDKAREMLYKSIYLIQDISNKIIKENQSDTK